MLLLLLLIQVGVWYRLAVYDLTKIAVILYLSVLCPSFASLAIAALETVQCFNGLAIIVSLQDLADVQSVYE